MMFLKRKNVRIDKKELKKTYQKNAFELRASTF
jgi:hypothetical protein